MRDQLGKLFVSKTQQYTFIGFLFGLCFAVAILFLAIRLEDLPVTLDSFLRVQLANRVFLLVRAVPLLLGYLGYRVGSRGDALDEINNFIEMAGESGIDALVEQKLYYEALLKNVPIAVVSMDLEQNVTAANPAFEELFGFEQAELKNRKLDPMITAVDHYGEAKGFTDEVAKGDKIEAVAVRRHKNGSLIEVEIKGVPIMAHGRQIGVLGIYQNLSEQKRHEETLKGSLSKMEELARVDPLTQLLNRRGMTEHIQLAFDRAREDGSMLGLALVDLDYLKQINDNHGHLAGDEALKLLSRTLESSCRANDKVARWGGDEFMMVLPNIDAESAKKIGRRVLQKVNEQKLNFDEEESGITISIGMTSIQNVNGTNIGLEDIFRETDKLLYEAKTAGRNRLSYSPMNLKN